MKGRILVVDDDTALSEMLGIVLRGEGFEPFLVSDGDHAVSAFKEFSPDASWQGRHRDLSRDPGRERRPHRHAHG
jgi:PleD family two-component response regulator